MVQLRAELNYYRDVSAAQVKATQQMLSTADAMISQQQHNSSNRIRQLTDQLVECVESFSRVPASSVDASTVRLLSLVQVATSSSVD